MPQRFSYPCLWCPLQINPEDGAVFSSAVDQAWRFLQTYIDHFTQRNGPIYYKPVARKLASLGCILPVWLVNAYKTRNPAELLQIYINFDLLEEAANLAGDYIQAVLGHGKEYFGLQASDSGGCIFVF